MESENPGDKLWEETMSRKRDRRKEISKKRGREKERKRIPVKPRVTCPVYYKITYE